MLRTRRVEDSMIKKIIIELSMDDITLMRKKSKGHGR